MSQNQQFTKNLINILLITEAKFSSVLKKYIMIIIFKYNNEVW